MGQNVGSAMHSINYHYWYHIGEIQAIRQMLGHKNLPVFVGALEGKAPYPTKQDKSIIQFQCSFAVICKEDGAVVRATPAGYWIDNVYGLERLWI